MGVTYKISCKNCHYTIDLTEGFGMMYGDLMNVVSSLRKNNRSKVLEIIKKNNLSTFYNENAIYEHRIFRSRKTGEFYNRFYVKLFKKDESKPIFETIYRCPKSKTIMEQVKIEDIFGYQCPKCNKKKLKNIGIIEWD